MRADPNPTVKSHPEVDLGTDLEPYIVAVRTKLEGKVENRMIALLNEYCDAFSWSYANISGINIDIVVHHFYYGLNAASQMGLRGIKPLWNMKTKEEVSKQLEASFLDATD